MSEEKMDAVFARAEHFESQCKRAVFLRQQLRALDRAKSLLPKARAEWWDNTPKGLPVLDTLLFEAVLLDGINEQVVKLLTELNAILDDVEHKP